MNFAAMLGANVDQLKEGLLDENRGGEHSYRNVAVSCPTCNLRKGRKIRGQFRLF